MTFAPAIFMRKCTGPREAQACFSRPRQGREGSGDVPQTTEAAALAADAPPISQTKNAKRVERNKAAGPAASAAAPPSGRGWGGVEKQRLAADSAHLLKRKAQSASSEARGVWGCAPVDRGGRGADGQTQCLASSGRAQFATPSGLAICERHGVAWPKAARRAVPLRGSRGTKRCGRVQGGPWTSPERFHTERSND